MAKAEFKNVKTHDAAPAAAKKSEAAPPADPPKTTALATTTAEMFEADAGSGMEGTTRDSFAIPFLMVLQKGSPQVDEASGVAIEGAKAGMLFDNVAGRLYDGKTGVIVIPCAYRRVFLHWGPREGAGQGFKGELLPEQVAELRAAGKIVEVDNRLLFPMADGTLHDKKCDRASDTRNHYVLVVNRETGNWTTALLSLTSTQIKKSKALMSMVAGVKLRNRQTGASYTPPTYANFIRVTTVPESNDKGTWYGVKFEILPEQVDRQEFYAAAKTFHASVVKGDVTAKYEEGGFTEAAADRGNAGADDGSF